jgi:pimeloyl-ACP methyl ester carboxylesterase
MLNQIHKDIKKLEKKNDPKDATVLKLMKLMLEEPHIAPAALQSIRAKTLIMAGEKDVILEKHTRLIAASIPNATLKILKGQTHWVVTEDPALLGKEVLDFLSQQ